MKIPQTTKENPYIQFLFDTKGNITLSATSKWWGGIDATVVFSNNDTEKIKIGNSCKPEDLERFIIVFKKNQIEEVKEEIVILQEKLKQLKSIPENWELDTDLVEDNNTVTLS